MALIKCTECGKEISDKAKECIHCGCPVSASIPKMINCPECGKEISAEAKSCGHCGFPISASQTTNSENIQKVVNDIIPSAKFILTKDFEAVLSGSASESSRQTVYVQEMGRNVSFDLPNNFKIGEIMRIEVENDKYSHVNFRVANIVKSAPSTQSVSQTSASDDAIKCIKWYKPNGMINFLKSRRFYSIIFIFVAAIIYTSKEDLDMLLPMIVVCGIFTLPLVLSAVFYPMHHIKKYFRKNNIESAIRNDSGYMNVAITAYNAKPSKQMLKYIRSINLEAAQKIEQQLAERKNK